MIIFIDESGDAGFKTNKGSSEFFVIALIIFDNESDAETTNQRIQDFKNKRRTPLRSETKFNKLSKSERIKFLTAIKNCEFKIRAIIVKKEIVESQNIKTDTTFYYQYFLKQLLEHNREYITDAKLRLDSLSERKFKKAMSAYLRQNLNIKTKEKVMKDLQFVSSKNNSLIQLADMIAGSLRRSYQDKNDRKIYKEIIKNKVEDEWLLGK